MWHSHTYTHISPDKMCAQNIPEKTLNIYNNKLISRLGSQLIIKCLLRRTEKIGIVLVFFHMPHFQQRTIRHKETESLSI